MVNPRVLGNEPVVRLLHEGLGSGILVVDEVVYRRKVPIYFVTVSTLTVLAGVILYWRAFGGINTSPFGVALGLGGLAAFIAWLGSNLLIPRTFGQLTSIGAEIRAGGGPPSAELASRMHATQERRR